MQCFFWGVLKVQEIAAELNEATSQPGYRTIDGVKGWLRRAMKRKGVKTDFRYKPEEIKILERYVSNENGLTDRKKAKKWISEEKYKKS